jgi:hypothetical protein
MIWLLNTSGEEKHLCLKRPGMPVYGLLHAVRLFLCKSDCVAGAWPRISRLEVRNWLRLPSLYVDIPWFSPPRLSLTCS